MEMCIRDRYWVVVYTALAIRHIYRAHLLGEGLDHRRRGETDCESYGYGEQYPHPQLKVEQHLVYTPKAAKWRPALTLK